MALYEGSAAELLKAGAGGGQGLTGALCSCASVLWMEGGFSGYVPQCVDEMCHMLKGKLERVLRTSTGGYRCFVLPS